MRKKTMVLVAVALGAALSWGLVKPALACGRGDGPPPPTNPAPAPTPTPSG